MLLREGESYIPQSIHVFFNNGGLGDNIARLPALRYLTIYYPHVHVTLHCPKHYMELASECLPGVEVRDQAEGDGKYAPAYYFESDSYISSLGHHLTDLAFSQFINRSDISWDDKSYLRLPRRDLSFNLPRDFVVLTPGYTAKAREMPGEVFNEITRGIHDRGLYPVFLGRKFKEGTAESFFNEEVDYSLGKDLRDKTTLLEAGEVIARAKAIVGIDNGLIHLAGMTETPIVVGYSSQVPHLRAPIRDGILGKDCWYVLPDSCQGCEAKVRFDYKHDFRECLFKDYRCISEMTARKYLEALDRCLT